MKGHHNHLLNLPYTVFLEILTHLPAVDVLRCRCLSRDALTALTRQDLCVSLILHHFPRSREGRHLRDLRQRSPGHGGDGDEDEKKLDWAAAFAVLTRRYFHLANAMPWRVDKVEILSDADRLRGVTPWNRFLRLEDKTAPFHYWDPTWTYASALGLLVFPDPDGRGYQLRDVETRLDVEVPFDVEEKVVRRVRLSDDGVLVFEWCEERAYHALNEREVAHRHYATAYDVTQLSSSSSRLTSWGIRFRSEWKIHYLGLPLSHHDRFFSTHNATHYVIYIWQPTRSPWGEDAPLERLIIWDISQPSAYRPSLDPGGKPPADEGPRIVRRLINRDLDFWGVRQSDTPSLRRLDIDACTRDPHTGAACGHVFVHQEEHRWSAGPHSSADQPRLHRVKATGIPLEGAGPRWLDDCGGGDAGGFCWRGPRARQQHEDEDGVGEEARRDERDAWAGRASCWRHDDFPYLTVSEVFDATSGVRISARQCFMLETLSVHVRPKLRVTGVDAVHSEGGRRCQSGGGSHRSSVGVPEDDNDDLDEHFQQQEEGEEEEWRPRGAGTRIEGPGGDEVQFADDLWNKLLSKGFICGDERRLVGEDQDGNVTIVHF